MEQRPTYEVLIAGKLEALPIPDMADAIWARIETQLDLDLPTTDGGSDPTPPRSSGPGWMGWGLSLFLAALVMLFLLYRNKPTPQPIPQSTPVQTDLKNGPARTTSSPEPELVKKDSGSRLAPAKSNAAVNRFALRDSITQQPVVSVATPQSDSASNLNAAPLVVTPPAKKDSITSQKKKRGVSGLTDADYRIVPSKDSL